MAVDRYPKVHDEWETLARLEAGASLARYGDGEFKLALGREMYRETPTKEKTRLMRHYLCQPVEGLLVGIPTMDKKGPKYRNWKRWYVGFCKVLSPEMQYYSAFISRPDSAPWIDTPEFVQRMIAIWQDRHVTVMAEDGSAVWRLVHKTAKNVASVICPHKETIAQRVRLVDEILGTNPEVVVLSAGAGATIIAGMLTELGVQAIDLGHAGQFMLRQIGDKRWDSTE